MPKKSSLPNNNLPKSAASKRVSINNKESTLLRSKSFQNTRDNDVINNNVVKRTNKPTQGKKVAFGGNMKGNDRFPDPKLPYKAGNANVINKDSNKPLNNGTSLHLTVYLYFIIEISM